VAAYTLTNGKLAATILNFGGIVTHLMVPDKAGVAGDVTLGWENLAQYEASGPYLGALIGRVGNRIAKGKFEVDGQTYTVAANNGPNHLHGGIKGYDKRVWEAKVGESAKGPTLTLTLTDTDGTEGYPGTVKVKVVYTLTATALRIEYSATTDKATPINLTYHGYFNLKDGGVSDMLGHVLQMEADEYTPMDAESIPTGAVVPVKGTAMDFTTGKPIGQDLKASGGNPVGFDDNVVLRGAMGKLRRAATVTEPTSGRKMEVWTTEPGMQFYSGKYLDGSKGKGGVSYGQYHGFCLETQHHPDSVHRPEWPTTIVRPGEKYKSVTEYRFGVA
jgi:aldose 1-epimerase